MSDVIHARSGRDLALDQVKGLAIFLVVWGHWIQAMLPDRVVIFFRDPAIIFIYSFHMPLFMAISGYLFPASEARYSGRSLIMRKGAHLLFPALAWSVIACLAVDAHRAFAGGQLTFHLQDTLWFLTANMCCILIVYGCDRLRAPRPAVYLLAMAALLALPDSYDLAYVKFLLPYFVAGAALYRYRSHISKRVIGTAWIVALVVWCVLLFHWKPEYFVYASGMSFYVPDWRHQMFVVCMRYLAGFAGITVIVPGVYFLSRYQKLAPLAYFGRYTLGIYCLSVSALPILRHLGLGAGQTAYRDFIVAPALAVITCLVSIFAITLVQKSKYARLVLLGELSPGMTSRFEARLAATA